jgi:AbrB family looped-hinge helix DNA binding protein
MKTAIISDKGQITLPSEIRRQAKLRPGMQVQVEIRDDDIVLHPVKSLRELAGIFAGHVGATRESDETIRVKTQAAIAAEVADEGRA